MSIVKVTILLKDFAGRGLILPGVDAWVNTDHVIYSRVDDEGNTRLHLVSGEEIVLAPGTEYLFRGDVTVGKPTLASVWETLERIKEILETERG